MNEKVLVFPSHLLDGWLEKFEVNGGLLTGADAAFFLSGILDSKELFYKDRAEAETDEGFKQLIPYTVIVHADRAFVYERTPKGGEGRLHGKLSLGVGGHINPEDGEENASYWTGFRRELAEEVGLKSDKIYAPIRGVIYDASNAVGRVHLGVVHVLKVPSTAIRVKDEALTAGQWRDVEWLTREDNLDRLESWSRLLVEPVVLRELRLAT